MRSFIRHDNELPIHVCLEADASGTDRLRNVSQGGLSFCHPTVLPVGGQVRVTMAANGSLFEAPCRVVWCRPEGEAWQVGVAFLEQDDLFRARMFEQVGQIEQYRQQECLNKGRNLSCQEAAIEWIGKFAAMFPRSKD